MVNIGTTTNDYAFWRRKPASYVTSTATGSTIVKVKNSDGILAGLLITSPLGGTYKVWDNYSGTGTVLINTTTSTTGMVLVPEVYFATGLSVTFTNTASLTVFYK
jgi:hypothetical protein